MTVEHNAAKQYLNNCKSVEDCIKLACKEKGANYIIYESGKCHALHCKKNTCKISEDAKSKQKIVGLARREEGRKKRRSKKATQKKKKGEL